MDRARHMLILGIETSCDETAAAVIRHDGATAADARGTVLSNVVFSQIDEHALFGGVVPELAARAHVDRLDTIVAEALAEAKVSLADLDGIAATAGPGLIGGVMVGLMTGKALALASGKPLIAVNHLEGHALTPRLTDQLAFPYLMLLVSGGHSQFVAVDGLGRYTRMGTTLDDALGEAFDKTAKLLGLPYPGGPALEARAKAGDPTRFDLPRPLGQKGNLDFSFSGLKTAVRLAATRVAPLTERDVDDLAASFQAAVADVVEVKATAALRRFAEERDLDSPVLVPAGGVAANGAVRAALARAAAAAHGRVVLPPLALCTDNGAMIAWAGAERLASGDYDGMDAPARPRWPLDATAPPKLGSGRLGAKA